MFRAIPLKYVLPLLGLTVSAFIFNTSEFMPIGLLMDISQSFAMTESQTGIMITVYAWVVALLSLPLMLLVCQMEMRRLLLGTMGLFVLGQLASGLALNFPMLMAARIGVACAHSIFWSIAAPMATRLVTRTHRPLALSMIVTGSAVAMIFGLPLGRVIGLYAGWRMTFLVITVTALAVLIYLAFVFPKLASDASFSRDELPKLLKNPVVISVYILSVLFATAYFTAYSYIEPFLKTVAAFSDQGITSTLMLLGVSGLLGSFVFSRFYNHFRYGVIRAGLLGLVIPFLLWQAAAGRAGRWSPPAWSSAVRRRCSTSPSRPNSSATSRWGQPRWPCPSFQASSTSVSAAGPGSAGRSRPMACCRISAMPAQPSA